MRYVNLAVPILIAILTTGGFDRLAGGGTTPEPPDIAVFASAIPVTGDDGRVWLAYELLVSALDPRLALERLEVVTTGQEAGDDAEIIASFGDAALHDLAFDWAIRWDSTTVLPASGGAYSMPLEDGRGRILYLALPFRDAAAVPERVAHRLILRPRDSKEDFVLVEGAAVRPSGAPVALGPPLAEGPWLVVGGLSEEPSHHRISLVTFDQGGHLNLPQRFAIDFLGLDAEGRSGGARGGGEPLRHRGAFEANEDYPAHGRTVLAVADGVVRFVRGSIPENEPGMSRAVPMTIKTVSGNEIVLELEEGIVARYAHLEPGSLLVREGERVRRGQPIARVGNSGSSMLPHLHFDVVRLPPEWREAVRDAGLAARWKVGQGVPFTFDAFELLGRCEEEEEVCRLAEPVQRRDALPLDRSTIRFPARP